MADLPWEDNLLERKTENDLADLLKTIVAFANSVRPGHVATILIGERDDGTIAGVKNPDNIQKKVQEECKKVYPAIVSRSKVYGTEPNFCVRVEIEYSGDTPHFGGPAWIRKGSTTVKATDEIFQSLIDIRTGIVFELSKWVDKEVTVHGDPTSIPPARTRDTHLVGKATYFAHRWGDHDTAVLISVNNFWVTLDKRIPAGPASAGQWTVRRQSEPLGKVTLSFDNDSNRLKLHVQY